MSSQSERRGRGVIDLGVFPGTAHAKVTTGVAGLRTTDNPSVWLVPVTTADHSADEHGVEPLELVGTCEADDLLTVHVRLRSAPVLTNFNNNTPTAYGLWTIAWEF